MKMQWKKWTYPLSWIIAVLLCAAGMALGYELGSETAGFLGGEPGIGARLGKGFVWGAVMAGLQWPVVRFVGVRPLIFIAASAVGLAIGYPVGQTIQSIFVQQWSFHWMGYWLAVATFGLFLSLPQWLIFLRHLKRPGLWILFSVGAWMVSGAVWSGPRIDVLDSVLYGLVAGSGLVWLSRSQRPQVPAGTS